VADDVVHGLFALQYSTQLDFTRPRRRRVFDRRTQTAVGGGGLLQRLPRGPSTLVGPKDDAAEDGGGTRACRHAIFGPGTTWPYQGVQGPAGLLVDSARPPRRTSGAAWGKPAGRCQEIMAEDHTSSSKPGEHCSCCTPATPLASSNGTASPDPRKALHDRAATFRRPGGRRALLQWDRRTRRISALVWPTNYAVEGFALGKDRGSQAGKFVPADPPPGAWFKLGVPLGRDGVGTCTSSPNGYASISAAVSCSPRRRLRMPGVVGSPLTPVGDCLRGPARKAW